MGSKTDYLEDKMINHVLRNTSYTPPVTLYLAMFTTDPTETGAAGTEVSGGAYARQTVAFDAPSPSGVTQNTSLVTFPTATASWGTVSHWMLMDAVSGGNGLYFGAWDAAQSIGIGGIAEVAVGELKITED